MKRGALFSARTRLLPLVALLVAPALVARAQETPPGVVPDEWAAVQARLYEEMSKVDAARKIDEFGGRLGHCDLTARLDNLAIHVQALPTLKAYVIVRNPAGAKTDEARYHMQRARYYLTEERGLARERVVAIHGGSGGGDEVSTELWVVPDGAEPPARQPDEV
ncbi:MAG TPA: hypothetical protein VGV38_02895, partial [Pyrinomonadaceae bacterium]|nr:hypothetical protein [Pyrinomonadaceae bacterium]